MSSARTGGPGPRSGLVGSQAAHPSMGSFLFVEVDPVGDDDARLGQRVELVAVEAFAAEAGAEVLDEAVLLGRAEVDVEHVNDAAG